MPSQYNVDTKAQALALMAQGETAEAAAAALRLPARTVQHWRQRWRQIAAEEDDPKLLEEDYRIALRYSELLHLAADHIGEDESGERAAKSLIAINAVRGTAIDKILRRRESQRPNDDRRPLVIFIQGSAAVRVTDGERTSDIVPTTPDVAR